MRRSEPTQCFTMNNEEVLADESAVEQAKDYLRQGDTIEFFEKLATRLLTHQPNDPVDYSLEYVEYLMNAAPGARLDPEAATTHATPVANREEESKYVIVYLLVNSGGERQGWGDFFFFLSPHTHPFARTLSVAGTRRRTASATSSTSGCSASWRRSVARTPLTLSRRRRSALSSTSST